MDMLLRCLHSVRVLQVGAIRKAKLAAWGACLLPLAATHVANASGVSNLSPAPQLSAGVFAIDPSTPVFPPVSNDETELRLSELAHKPWDGSYLETGIISGKCIVSEIQISVTDPRSGESWPIHTTLYRPNTLRKVSLSLLVPTIEGVTILEPHVARVLCDAGMGAMIAMLHDTTQPVELPAWGHEDRVNRREILGLRTLLDFAQSDTRFDRQQIGMMGLSLGGIVTALMAGLEPDRLRSVVTVVGAGNLPYILAISDNDQVSELRKRRMAYLGVTDLLEYEELLKQHLRYDPMVFAHRVRRERLFMVMSTVDTTVPAPVQRATYEAFGRPEYMIFNWGHIGTLLQLTYLYMDPVKEFMAAQFENRPAKHELFKSVTNAVSSGARPDWDPATSPRIQH